MPRNRSQIYNAVVVSSCLFGSVFVFSNSFNIINGLSVESKNGFVIEAARWITVVVSGSMFVYGLMRLKDT